MPFACQEPCVRVMVSWKYNACFRCNVHTLNTALTWLHQLHEGMAGSYMNIIITGRPCPCIRIGPCGPRINVTHVLHEDPILFLVVVAENLVQHHHYLEKSYLRFKLSQTF